MFCSIVPTARLSLSTLDSLHAVGFECSKLALGTCNFFQGIDIGTTSVKVCVMEKDTRHVVARQTKDTQANVPSDLGYEGHKQNPPKIISALHACVSRLPRELTKKVEAIGICGQMHGVMLWGYDVDDEGTPWTKDQGRYDVRPSGVSSLYTWQDSRCTPQFLATLPKPKSHLKASTGYGVNTIFWFSRNKPDKLEKFNCAGTIQDFAVAMLCNLEKPVMSTQNAAGWGYFDTVNHQWNMDILREAGFPVKLLPQVVESGKMAGRTYEEWHGIPQGTPVVAALGDVQCSVLSALQNKDDAVLSITTSAQLAFVVPSFELHEEIEEEGKGVEMFPYFNGNYLAMAASLNGGNALASFITMLQQWLVDLGSPIPQSALWEKSILAASKISETTLSIEPTLLGERTDPDMQASVSRITTGNLSLGSVFKAACTGVVLNLYKMMPREMLLTNNISRIVGIGSALNRNPVLQEEVKKHYQLPIVFEGKTDEAWGAAKAAVSLVSIAS